MSDENDEQMIPTPSDFGHFLLEKELGHGGMGGVYLARDKMLDRRVGIKVMLKSLGDDPAFVERFQREAQAAARLNHPNIAQIYSFGQEHGMPYIAMELVSGGSLDKEMEENPGSMDPVRVMKIGQQMADALALAAEQGLVHGDVKPENVLFDTDGNAKLVDFGLAAMQGDSNEIWGTPYYISPEKVRRQKIDYRADIYSLGGTLYHALTGVAPFEGEDATEVVKARFNGPPKKPSEVRPDLPAEIDSIIMRMLEVEPSMRYPTYQSLLGDFKRYLSKAGPVKTQKLGGPRVKIKGTKIKMKLTADEGGGVADEGVTDLDPIEGEELEEEKPSSVGKIVGLSILGVILVFGALGGSLYWWTTSKAKAEQAAVSEKLRTNFEKARQSIQGTMKTVDEYGAKCHKEIEEADQNFDKQMREIKSLLPPSMRELAAPQLSLPPTKDIEAAVAYTNRLFSAPVAAVQSEPVQEEPAKTPAATNVVASAAAGTNAVAAVKGGTNVVAAVKADAPKAAAEPPKVDPPKDEKAEVAKDAEAKETEEKQDLPRCLKDLEEVWGKVCFYRAVDVRVQARVKKLLAKAQKGLDDYQEMNEENLNALVELGRDLVSEFDAIRSGSLSDALDEAAQAKVLTVSESRKRLRDSKARLDTLPGVLKRQVNVIVKKAERAAEEKADKEAKAAAAAKADEEHKAKVEEESKAAEEAFEALVASRLKYLDWKRAVDQLTKQMDERTATLEAKDVLRAQIRKVKCMEETQLQLVKGLKKYIKDYEEARDGKQLKPELKLFRFNRQKTSFPGAPVTAADGEGFTVVPVKKLRSGKIVEGSPKTVTWKALYNFRDKQEYVYCLCELIEALVLKGNENVGTSKVAGARQMLGAALTLKLLCTEVDMAQQFVPVLVQQAVKDDEDAAKWAKAWFPDVNLEAE